jgi:NAD(P)-dependent dehydrogenase (short-subunit alcohol dehydrogenase family)
MEQTRPMMPGMPGTATGLRDRAALVSGGASGIGKATAFLLAREGARVVVADIRAQAAEDVAARLRAAGGWARGVACDVANPAAVRAAVDAATSAAGPIEVLVQCAGVLRRGAVDGISEAEWDLVVDTNLKGAFLLAQAVMRPMREGRWGRIVNVSSLAGRSTSVLGGAHYTAAKAGLLGLTRHLARELASSNVTVNAVCPGATDTPMTRGSQSAAEFEAIGRKVPLGRWASPWEVAQAILFLASEAAGYITGATLDVNGGILMI